MAEDNFKRFKKQLESGQTKVLAIPPPVPPAGGFLKTAAQIGGRFAKPLVEAGARKVRELAEGATKEVKPSRAKPSRAKPPEGAGKTGGKGRSGTLSEKLEATRNRPRTQRESEKFGPLAKRQDNLPAVRGSRALVKREDRMPAKIERGTRDLTVVREGKTDLQRYNPGSRSVAQTGTRTFGDKGQAGRIVGLSPKGKLAAGALGLGLGAAGYGLYKKASEAGAGAPQAGGGMRLADTPRDDRASSGTNKPAGPLKSEFAKNQQGMKVKGSPTYAASANKSVGQAGDKSRLSGKMSNFERMKMRQYEKEGFGGRSMTSAGAKARVMEERGYKFSDLFKKKK